MSLTELRGLTFRGDIAAISGSRGHGRDEFDSSRPLQHASIGAVYASAEPATAVEELRRRAARDGTSVTAMHPRSIFALRVDLHAMVDLTAPNVLVAWGLNSSDLERDDFTRCQGLVTVARDAYGHTIEALCQHLAQESMPTVRLALAASMGGGSSAFVDRPECESRLPRLRLAGSLGPSEAMLLEALGKLTRWHQSVKEGALGAGQALTCGSYRLRSRMRRARPSSASAFARPSGANQSCLACWRRW